MQDDERLSIEQNKEKLKKADAQGIELEKQEYGLMLLASMGEYPCIHNISPMEAVHACLALRQIQLTHPVR